MKKRGNRSENRQRVRIFTVVFMMSQSGESAEMSKENDEKTDEVKRKKIG